MLKSNSMAQKIIIADITSLKNGNISFGHYIRVAKIYQEIFQQYNIVIAGGPIYKKYFCDNLDLLDYDVDIKEHKNFGSKTQSKIKELKNALKVFKLNYDSILIFQDFSNLILFLSIAFARKKKNKIFVIQYKDEITTLFRRIIFNLAKRKIDGILCSQKSIGEKYGVPYLVLPDYIYTENKMPVLNKNCKYDFGVFGIIREGKDVVGVAKKFIGLSQKLLIAGAIQNTKMRDELTEISLSNPNIVVLDKKIVL